MAWFHLAMKPNGDLRICCQSGQGPNKGLLRKDSGDVYNLNRDSLMSSRNASLVRDVRLSLLKGEKHAECRRCWEEEAVGIHSRRLQALEYMNHYEESVDMTAPDGSIPSDTPYYEYDVRFGNLCNLKCRMCGPTDSSMWYDDYFKIKGHVFEDHDLSWYTRPDIWEDFDSQMKNIKWMYIIGGEPTLIQNHFDFLQRCVDNGYAKDLSLEYSTNVTNIQQKYLDIWSNFKKVHLGCSVDGFGKVNEYVRFPSKWKMIEKNLGRINDRPENMRIVLQCTVSAYNIYYLDELYRWNAENYNFIINPHTLYRPQYLSTKIYPVEVKEKIAEKLRAFYPWFRENNPETKVEEKATDRSIGRIENHIDFMMSEHHNQEIKEFWDVTRKLDEIRKENIEDCLPELYDLIKETEFKRFY